MLTQITVFALCIAAAAADTLEVAQDAVAKARWAPLAPGRFASPRFRDRLLANVAPGLARSAEGAGASLQPAELRPSALQRALPGLLRCVRCASASLLCFPARRAFLSPACAFAPASRLCCLVPAGSDAVRGLFPHALVARPLLMPDLYRDAQSQALGAHR